MTLKVIQRSPGLPLLPHAPQVGLVSPYISSSVLVDQNVWPSVSGVGLRQSCGFDAAIPVGLEGRAFNERGLFLSLKIEWNLLSCVLNLLGKHPSYLLLISPFLNENIYSLPVTLLYLGSNNLVWLHRDFGEEFCLEMNHISRFRQYLDETLDFSVDAGMS